MIKSDMIASLSLDFTQYSEKIVATAVNDVMHDITEAITNGKRIEIRGFGSFSLRYRPPRRAHNPKTGEKLRTLPKYSPHFKPGKELRVLVDNSRKKE